MGIQTLPPTTVRAIGAAQALNDPADVIKELIDNALDARATSIAIEISSNTLDSIQLRDNGHGIPPEDRALMARLHCTSKIRGEEELKAIGGASLGFRGEALASLAEMSGSLTITTRVEGEQIAAALKIDRQGEVVSQERSSLPTGTTVKVLDFLKANPVRRQVILKNNEKCLVRIRHWLQSYAFARPHVRFNLRVLKSKGDKWDWTYSPKPGGNAGDVAFRVLGAACASQCIWSIVENQGFTLKTFLPKPEVDESKISNVGAFFSVDNRPVSVTRGILKQVVKMFRESLKKASPQLAGLRDPFIYLAISCPPKSYDVNVEPAKDDVLFENPEVVVDLARQIFATVYSAPDDEDLQSNRFGPRPLDFRETGLLPETDDLSTALSPPRESNVPLQSDERHVNLVTDEVIREITSRNDAIEEERPATDAQPAFRRNMYGCDEEDLTMFDAPGMRGETDAQFHEFRGARRDTTVFNPWVTAKMNASLRIRDFGQDQSSTQKQLYSDECHTAMKPGSDLLPEDLDIPCLPTPRPSSPLLLAQTFHHAVDIPHSALEESRLAVESSAPRRSSSGFHQALSTVTSSIDGYAMPSQTTVYPAETPSHAIPDVSTKRTQGPKKRDQRKTVNMSFRPPSAKEGRKEKVWFDHLESQIYRQPHQSKKRRGPETKKNSANLVPRGELGDFTEDPHPITPPRRNRDMRDFVTRKNLLAGEDIPSTIETGDRALRKAVAENKTWLDDMGEENSDPAQDGRGRACSSMGDASSSDILIHGSNKSIFRPSKRRKPSESQDLGEVSSNKYIMRDDENKNTGVSANKSAISRRRRTTDRNKVHGRKSSRLPLESICPRVSMQNAVLNLSISTSELSGLALKMGQADGLGSFHQTTLSASESGRSAFHSVDVNVITQKVYQLLRERGFDGEMVQDLSVLVQSALERHLYIEDAGYEVA